MTDKLNSSLSHLSSPSLSPSLSPSQPPSRHLTSEIIEKPQSPQNLDLNPVETCATVDEILDVNPQSDSVFHSQPLPPLQQTILSPSLCDLASKTARPASTPIPTTIEKENPIKTSKNEAGSNSTSIDPMYPEMNLTCLASHSELEASNFVSDHLNHALGISADCVDVHDRMVTDEELSLDFDDTPLFMFASEENPPSFSIDHELKKKEDVQQPFVGGFTQKGGENLRNDSENAIKKAQVNHPENHFQGGFVLENMNSYDDDMVIRMDELEHSDDEKRETPQTTDINREDNEQKIAVKNDNDIGQNDEHNEKEREAQVASTSQIERTMPKEHVRSHGSYDVEGVKAGRQLPTINRCSNPQAIQAINAAHTQKCEESVLKAHASSSSSHTVEADYAAQRHQGQHVNAKMTADDMMNNETSSGEQQQQHDDERQKQIQNELSILDDFLNLNAPSTIAATSLPLMVNNGNNVACGMAGGVVDANLRHYQQKPQYATDARPMLSVHVDRATKNRHQLAARRQLKRAARQAFRNNLGRGNGGKRSATVKTSSQGQAQQDLRKTMAEDHGEGKDHAQSDQLGTASLTPVHQQQQQQQQQHAVQTQGPDEADNETRVGDEVMINSNVITTGQNQACNDGLVQHANDCAHQIHKLVTAKGRIEKQALLRRGGNRNPATAHLSMEERRQIRAQRNRESAEKSRIRRKQQTAELEQSVGDLRGENKQLKMRLDGLEQLIKDAQNALGLKMSPSVDGHGMGNAGSMTEGGEGINGEAHKKLRALQESLRLIQICKRRCIRTFREGPQSQEIQLKLAK